MKISRIVVLYLISIFFLAACSTSESGKRAKDKTRTEVVPEKIDTLSINQDTLSVRNGTCNNNIVPSKSKREEDGRTWLLYISLFVNLFLVGIFLYLLRKHKLLTLGLKSEIKRLESDKQNYETDRKCKEAATGGINNIKNSNAINDEIEIISTDRSDVSPDYQKPQNKKIKTEIKHYAGSVDEDTSEFISVKDKYDSSTYFELTEAEENEATFTFAQQSISILLYEAAYLYHACDIRMTGNTGSYSKIETVEKGMAQKQENGKWKVIKKATIKYT